METLSYSHGNKNAINLNLFKMVETKFNLNMQHCIIEGADYECIMFLCNTLERKMFKTREQEESPGHLDFISSIQERKVISMIWKKIK